MELPRQTSEWKNTKREIRLLGREGWINLLKAAAVVMFISCVCYGVLFFRLGPLSVHVTPAVAVRNITRAGANSLHSQYKPPIHGSNASGLSVNNTHPLLLRLQTYGSPGFANQYHQFPIGPNGVPKRVFKCMHETVIIEDTLSNDMRRLTSKPKIDAVLFNLMEETFLNGQVGQLSTISAQIEASGQTQVWIFKGMEPSTVFKRGQGQVKNLPIHGMRGYHESSEVEHKYGHYLKGQPMPGYEDRSATAKSLAKVMAKKTNMAVWAAHNCLHTFWPRLEFIKSMKKMMEVDMYGPCGTLTCWPREPCLDVFEKYKFYLAFENSECDDYLTEKLWNALTHGIVPVVYGPRRENYKRFAPPNSFIHVADFSSTKALVDYLLFLDQNPNEYLKYFEWRTQGKAALGSPVTNEVDSICVLPELIRKVKAGQIKKHLMSETPYYNSCRQQKGYQGFPRYITNLAGWTPRK